MELENQNITELIFKYLTDELSEEETESLNKWLQHPYNKLQFDRLTEDRAMAEKLLLMQKMNTNKAWRKLQGKTTGKDQRKKYLSYAAVFVPVLFMASAVLYFFALDKPQYAQESLVDYKIQTEDVTLILDDGNAIEISDMDTSFVSHHADINIRGNEVNYIPEEAQAKQIERYNVIKIPRGKQYQITLADNTKVWLNANTTFKYPETFIKDKREVHIISGEAFFHVAKHKEKPFVVHFQNNAIRVLGTQFNVKAYQEDQMSQVTLAHGSIVLNSSQNTVKLSPDQQVEITGGQLELQTVDAGLFTAWKDQMFKYKRERLHMIMSDLSRYYDFKIFYRNESVKKEVFSLKIRHDESFTNILEYLEMTGKVHFEISGKNIIVQ
jgi:ferric-dicitrate binding protein FerR (iron transport regulator)